MRMHRPALRACAVAAGLLTVLFLASPAPAHVTVDTPDAAPGGFGKVVVRVPTESDTASTTKVTVDLPEDTPFAFVSSQTKPGWNVSIKKTKHDKPVKAGEFNVTETISQVTWTATRGHGIAPGEFDEFALSVGPFPDEPGAELSFPATQGYSDGSTVAWDQPTPKSGEEPEHPAPTLTLADDQPAGADRSGTEQSGPEQSGTDAISIGALAVAIAGLLVALVALALAARLRRVRR